MPTVTKNKATETKPKGAKATAALDKQVTVKKGQTAGKSEVAKKAVPPTKTTTKAEAKTPGKAKASTKTKRSETKEYKPNVNTMRYFIYESMKRGGSARKIKSRAATMAEKAGIEKFATAEAYKGFDVAFFANMLQNDYGIKVDIANNKYKLA